MPKRLRVALLIESSRSYGRNLLAGIAAYGRAFGPWTFYHEERNLRDRMPRALKDWRPDGIIVRMEDDALTRHLGRLKLPTVNVLHEEGLPGIPGVIPNQEAIARLAAEHLLERRLEHFAYCGLPGVVFSERRRRHFVECLAAQGHQVHVFEHRRSPRAKGLAEIETEAMLHAASLAAWLQQLPKPVGLMACNDMRAYQVLSVCGEQGILVPDQVAVIGAEIGRVRLDRVKELLTTSNLPLAKIARLAGFAHAETMQRVFKKAVGQTPGLYRKRRQVVGTALLAAGR